MKIDIHATHFSITAALRNHIDHRTQQSLGRFDDQISKVFIELSDINSPNAGHDMRCQARIVLESQKDILIEETQSELYLAIDRCLERASRKVVESLEQQTSPDSPIHPYATNEYCMMIQADRQQRIAGC